MNSELLTRLKTQIDGLKARPDLDKNAAFKAKDLEAMLTDLDALERAQETLKAELHAATQKIAVQQKAIRDAFQRNVAYAVMTLGKYDKTIETLGGKTVVRGSRRKKDDPVPAG